MGTELDGTYMAHLGGLARPGSADRLQSKDLTRSRRLAASAAAAPASPPAASAATTAVSSASAAFDLPRMSEERQK